MCYVEEGDVDPASVCRKKSWNRGKNWSIVYNMETMAAMVKKKKMSTPVVILIQMELASPGNQIPGGNQWIINFIKFSQWDIFYGFCIFNKIFKVFYSRCMKNGKNYKG